MRAPVIVQGRSCSGCTLCCKLLRIEELESPPSQWCPLCEVKSGCTIYARRPTECRQFDCEYLLDARLGEHWRPSRCKMVVVFEEHTNDLVIHVDPSRPDAWRQEPFRSDIRRWASQAAKSGRQVIVWEGDRKIAIAVEESVVHYGARVTGSEATGARSTLGVGVGE
jgi:hypothetical protein